jgi:hypothetical protein
MITPQSVYRGRNILISIKLEVPWNPESFWTLWNRLPWDKILYRIQHTAVKLVSYSLYSVTAVPGEFQLDLNYEL